MNLNESLCSTGREGQSILCPSERPIFNNFKDPMTKDGKEECKSGLRTYRKPSSLQKPMEESQVMSKHIEPCPNSNSNNRSKQFLAFLLKVAN